MRVFCIEGCHGVGKSTLLAGLAKEYIVLDEMFTDMPAYEFLSSQSLPMEFIWVANWFNRLLRIYERKGDAVVFADRSPYSAVYYSKASPETQERLRQLIRGMIHELAAKGIVIKTVCLKVKKDLLWKRIQARLEREPERARYNEGSYAWMEQTWNFFAAFPWDYVVENNEELRGNPQVYLWRKLTDVGIAIK